MERDIMGLLKPHLLRVVAIGKCGFALGFVSIVEFIGKIACSIRIDKQTVASIVCSIESMLCIHDY
jgi:hypothetical protein